MIDEIIYKLTLQPACLFNSATGQQVFSDVQRFNIRSADKYLVYVDWWPSLGYYSVVVRS